MPSHLSALIGDRRGASIVEFALVAPMLALLLFGLLGFGQLFWISHSVQQIANDAARATVAGLSAAERASLARTSADHARARSESLRATRLTVALDETAPWVTVTARYDVSDLAILRTGIVALPRDSVERRATVRMGGGA